MPSSSKKPYELLKPNNFSLVGFQLILIDIMKESKTKIRNYIDNCLEKSY